jgi:DNA-binding NtrC family response regulator
MIINTPVGREGKHDDSYIRKAAVQHKIPYITTVAATLAAVEGIEERLLRRALDQANGVKAEAARLLGIKASALYYKLEKYGIQG